MQLFSRSHRGMRVEKTPMQTLTSHATIAVFKVDVMIGTLPCSCSFAGVTLLLYCLPHVVKWIQNVV